MGLLPFAPAASHARTACEHSQSRMPVVVEREGEGGVEGEGEGEVQSVVQVTTWMMWSEMTPEVCNLEVVHLRLGLVYLSYQINSSCCRGAATPSICVLL
jgi:hypothetical protein